MSALLLPWRVLCVGWWLIAWTLRGIRRLGQLCIWMGVACCRTLVLIVFGLAGLMILVHLLFGISYVVAYPWLPPSSAPDRVHQPWRKFWEHPITQLLYNLLVILIFCTWPLLRWLVAADVLIQLLRILFVGGLSSVVALAHFLVIGAVAYLVLYAPPPRRR